MKVKYFYFGDGRKTERASLLMQRRVKKQQHADIRFEEKCETML
jgi:hypothetical protein